MQEKNQNETICGCTNTSEIYHIESILSIDSRGQILIPKDVRNKANITDGDKLALVTWGDQDKSCCIVLIPVHNLSVKIPDIMHSLLTEKTE